MTDLSPEWITAVFMLSMSAVVVYLIVTRDLRPWRRFVQALQADLGARQSASGVMHFERRGRSCQLSLHLVENGPARFRLAVSASVAATMTLHLRGTGDDLAASLGLAAPRSGAHPALGRNWLVDSTDQDAPGQLLADPAVPGQIQTLLRAGVDTIAWSEASEAVFFRGVSLRDAAGDISVLDQALALVQASSAPRPKALRKRWPGLAGWDADQPGSAVLGLLALALVLFALPTLPVVGIDAAYTPVDRSTLMLIAAALALPVTGIVASLAWRWSGRRMLDHRVLLMVVPIMAVGVWQLSYGAIVYGNGAWDTATPSVVDTTIEAKFRRATGRKSFEYRLNTQAGPFFVGSTAFEAAEVGGALRVMTRPGRLGFAWREEPGDIQLIQQR